MSDENTIQLDLHEIMEILPHRFPFLFIDRVTELVPGQYIKAYKNLTMNESFFQGHFPDRPVMPGVIMLESMAQASIILALKSLESDDPAANKLFVFSGIDNVRFRKPVLPGDKFEIICKEPRKKFALWKMRAEGYVDGVLVVEADLTAAAVDKE